MISHDGRSISTYFFLFNNHNYNDENDEDHEGYNHNSNLPKSLQFHDWMRYIPDDATITSLSIPGTHDSLSLCTVTSECNEVSLLKDITQTQSISLQNQLHAGIRFLDVRIKYDALSDEKGTHNENSHNGKGGGRGGGFGIYHGLIYQGMRLEKDVLEVVKDFLSTFQSETILIRLKDESESNFSSDDHILNSLVSTLGVYKEFMLPASCGMKESIKEIGLANLTLGNTSYPCHTRGKFIIMQDGYKLPTSKATFYVEDYPTDQEPVQDVYHASTIWDLANTKWPLVKEHMTRANKGKKSLLYINYMSMAFGSFPYFFASGQIHPRNGATKMSTGWTTKRNGKSDPCWYDIPHVGCKGKWPDFPRTNRICVPFVGCYGTISFEGIPDLVINHLAREKITQNNYSGEVGGKEDTSSGTIRLGIMVADFPGGGFIESVINTNQFHTFGRRFKK